MRILSRYVLREFFSVWLIVISALTVLLSGSQFSRALERAADAHLPNDIVPRLVLATFVQTLPIVGPMSLVLAIVLAVGRLSHDSELSAMRATGLSLWRVARYVMFTAFGFALVTAWLTLDLAPAMARTEQATLTEGLRRAQLAALAPARFTDIPGASTVIHVRSVGADGVLQQVLILRRDGDRLQVTTAKRATFESDPDGRGLELTAHDGEIVEGRPGDEASRRIRFGTLRRHIDFNDVHRVRASRDFLSTSQLAASSRPEDIAELQWRWSLAVMCAIVSCIALPISSLRPRQSRYARVLPAVLIFAAYLNALIAARNAMAHGALGAFPGMWIVHLAFAMLAAFILWWPGWRRRRGVRR